MSWRPRRDPGSLPDGWRLAIAAVTAATSGGAALLLVARDVGPEGYDAASSDTNTAWLLGAIAVGAVGYFLWILVSDVEEVIESQVREHRDELHDVERFEPKLFLWLLAGVAVVVLVALLL